MTKKIDPDSKDAKRYSTREISEHLYRYANFLDSESSRFNVVFNVVSDVTGERIDRHISNSLNREANDVREMATYLYKIKEGI